MTAQLTEGVELMLAGMGIVFLFLALLVVSVMIMSKLVLRYLPDISDDTPSSSVVQKDDSVTAAIAAAVHQYRKTHKEKK